MTTGNAINLSAAGLVTYSGTGSFTASTLTQYGIVVASTSNGVVSIAPSATSGVPLISQGSAANPVFGTAVVAGGGTGVASFSTNGVVISNTSGTGALAALSLSSGQLVIGGTTAPAAATLTAGAGISIGTGNNSITISAVSAESAWVDVTGVAQTLVIDTKYLADNAALVVFTLPATAVQFSVIQIKGYGAGGWSIVQLAGQQIRLGSLATTVGVTGGLASTNANDGIIMVAAVGGASTIWTVYDVIGNITVT